MRSGIARHIGDIATVQQGYTFKPGYQGQSSGEWMYVKVADIGSPASSKYLRRSLNYVSSEVLSEMRATPFPAGSIVFPRVGAALRNNNKRILVEDSLADDNVLVVTVRDKSVCDPEYLYYWFDFHDLQSFCNSGTVPVINGRTLKLQEVHLPPIGVQRRIASALSSWDTAIETTERLIAAKEAWASGIAKKLYRRKAHWHPRHLGSLLREVKALHGDGTYVIGSVGKNGIKPRSEVYSKALSDNHARNILVRPGWLCFGLASDAMAFGVNDTSQTYSVSPAYKTFQVVEADPQFVEGYLRVFNARLSKRYLITSARQGKAIDFDGLLNVELHIPAIDEQRRIAESLAIMQHEIDVSRALLDALKRQKRGLMQKLLTGEWRVPLPDSESTVKEAAPC